MSAPWQAKSALESAALAAARRAALRLAGLQAPDGHWCAELTADSTLESDYVLFQLWLYPPSGGPWKPPTRPLIDKAVRSIWRRQLPGGGFNIYAGGPAEVSASVKAYFALKLGGARAEEPRMVRLRDCILALGGLDAANSFVKINLSLFGLYPRESVRTFHRKRFCCRATSCTRRLPGRAPSWFRSPSSTPPTGRGPCRKGSTWTKSGRPWRAEPPAPPSLGETLFWSSIRC